MLTLPAGAASPRAKLPDLAIVPLQHMLIEITAEGKKRLRFTTSIANLGAGTVEIVAARPERGAEWKASQQIVRTDGSAYLVPLQEMRLVFAGGEEHGHWHMRDIARYELRRLGDLKKMATRIKRGFCFFDSNPYRRSLPGAPRKALFPKDGCGKKRALRIDMGISVGWRDDYYWRIPGQQMNITALPNGKYRLLAKVDPTNWFRESNERNNVTWVDLEIGDQLVKVLGRSPRL